jgi:3-oxoadipate CoA-transferase beta subunit
MPDAAMIPLDRNALAKRVARDIPDGAFVNLGIGMPTLVANHLPLDHEIFLHSENGLIGMGPRPAAIEVDWDLIDAGKQPVTILPGGAIFDSALSFAMMRGGHIDIAILGAYEVSAEGDLANWSTGIEGSLPAVGGAMDLAIGAKSIWIMMDHVTKGGTPRIINQCRYPLTAPRVVQRIYTGLAVMDLAPEGLLVREMVPGISLGELQTMTEATLVADPMMGDLVC